MFVLIYLIGYTAIVLLAVVMNALTGRYINVFDDNVKKGKYKWVSVWTKCRNERGLKFKKRYLKKLNNPYMAVAFHDFLTGLGKEQLNDFFSINEELIVNCVTKLKSNTIEAFFAYMLSKLTYVPAMNSSKYDAMLVDFLKDDSVYLRENTLKAIYNLGQVEKVINAYKILSDKKVYHSEKLLTDGLMSFSGDVEKLAGKLFLNFDNYEECYKTAIINFLSYENNHKYDEHIKRYIYENENSADLKCSMIRLIGKKVNDTNCKFIADYINQSDRNENWESIAVAVGVLGRFEKNEMVMETLLETITSPNWYIRMNSAKSICNIGINEEELNNIYQSNDRYAKNAIDYVLANR